MDDELRRMLAAKAAGVDVNQTMPPSIRSRVRRRRARLMTTVVAITAMVAVSAVAIGGQLTERRVKPAPSVSPAPNDFDIYTMATDGSNVIRVTEDPRNESQPAWSPDGKHLAFTRYEDGGSSHIYVTVPGRPERPLTRGRAIDQAPAWSPDGRYIAFTRTAGVGAAPRIFLIDLRKQHSAPKQLIEHVATSSEAWPSWSPDGKHIAFVGNDSTIFRFDFADGSVTPLVKSQGGFGKTVWGPNGFLSGFIATTVFNEDDDVYLVSDDGSGLHRLTDIPDAPDGYPTWSPDGTTIAFMTVAENGTDEIYTISAISGGGETDRLTDNKVDDGLPAWSPNGKRIAFASNR